MKKMEKWKNERDKGKWIKGKCKGNRRKIREKNQIMYFGALPNIIQNVKK